MKISIIGSRSFDDEQLFKETLQSLISGIDSPITIISGGAKGADSFAADFAIMNNYLLVIYKPDWRKHGKAAGVIRNTQIVSESDIVIAFWDGESKGTLDSINKAKKMNKELHIIEYKKIKNI